MEYKLGLNTMLPAWAKALRMAWARQRWQLKHSSFDAVVCARNDHLCPA
jgi:hypothetical protein